jgi:steroid delta-isomerase-like uncharacterized protein
MPESVDSLRALAQRWIIEGWQRGDATTLVALHSAEFVDYAAPTEREATREGFATGVADLYRAFPDFRATIDDLIVDTAAAKVAVRWSASGTHQGAYLGYPASGRRITFRGIEIIHVTEGLIDARWGEWDGLDLQRQLAGE